jgi:SPP1 family predicted phage head-tail adaptor
MMLNQSPPIDRLLIHTAELHRNTKRKNPAGGWTTSWGKVRDFNCRFTVYTPRDVKSNEDQRQSFPTNHMVVTRADEDIVEGDRFVFKGKTYEVLSPPLDPSFLGHHFEIEVKIVTKEV